jgi:hypothetical protein
MDFKPCFCMAHDVGAWNWLTSQERWLIEQALNCLSCLCTGLAKAERFFFGMVAQMRGWPKWQIWAVISFGLLVAIRSPGYTPEMWAKLSRENSSRFSKQLWTELETVPALHTSNNIVRVRTMLFEDLSNPAGEVTYSTYFIRTSYFILRTYFIRTSKYVE